MKKKQSKDNHVLKYFEMSFPANVAFVQCCLSHDEYVRKMSAQCKEDQISIGAENDMCLKRCWTEKQTQFKNYVNSKTTTKLKGKKMTMINVNKGINISRENRKKGRKEK